MVYYNSIVPDKNLVLVEYPMELLNIMTDDGLIQSLTPYVPFASHDTLFPIALHAIVSNVPVSDYWRNEYLETVFEYKEVARVSDQKEIAMSGGPGDDFNLHNWNTEDLKSS